MWNETVLNARRAQRRRDENVDAAALDAIVAAAGGWLKTGDLPRVLRINPHDVSRESGVPVERVVAEFLLGIEQRLFDLYWDTHCPHCNSITAEASTLRDARGLSACRVCDVEYEVDFTSRVEATFAFSKDILDLELPPVCILPEELNPQPVIKGLSAGETGSGTARLTAGEYRLICPITSSVARLTVSGAEASATQHLSLVQLDRRFAERELRVRPGLVEFSLENRGRLPTGLLVANGAVGPVLRPEALPPRLSGFELLHHPIFAELFGHESLSDRERLKIESVSILFSDITGSTALYEQLGDARAYNIVRDHFELLFTAIRASNGTVLKTIGDSVMASFVRAEDGLRAAVRASRAVEEYNSRTPEAVRLQIRLGLHSGPAILVNLNERLDYFGTTVNKSARIEELAAPGEVALSETVVRDTQSVLRELGVRRLRRRRFRFRGLAGEHAVLSFRPGLFSDQGGGSAENPATEAA